MDSDHYPKSVLEALRTGDIVTANALLGFDYFISGIVVRGQMLGRTLGFPTANLAVSCDTPLLIANGVYAVRVGYSGNSYLGMANIGKRPTLDGKILTVEVNLYDFDEEIYGESLTVYFFRRIRDEKKFAGIGELTREIGNDKQKVIELFSRINQPDSQP